jgi:chemotaxis protein MotB
VVRYLNEQGLPANRLAAAGYGEYQPLDTSDNDNARRKNRRIELKITQRVAIK